MLSLQQDVPQMRSDKVNKEDIVKPKKKHSPSDHWQQEATFALKTEGYFSNFIINSGWDR